MRYIITTLLICLFSSFIPGTTAPLQETSQWERYSIQGDESTALFPVLPTADHVVRPDGYLRKLPSGRMYAAYSEGAVYIAISFENVKKDSLETFIDEFPNYPVFKSGLTFERDISLKNIKGKRYHLHGVNTATDVEGIVQFYTTKSHAYIFEVISTNINQPNVQRFFESLTLDGKIKAQDINEALRAASQSALQKQTIPTANGNTSQSANQVQVFSPKDVTRKAVIATRPEPQYTEEARKNNVSGTVVLRAVLSSNGSVSGIRAISGLPFGLTEKAIVAAHHIKFLPAIKDGKAVSQYIQIEYNFNLY